MKYYYLDSNHEVQGPVAEWKVRTLPPHTMVLREGDGNNWVVNSPEPKAPKAPNEPMPSQGGGFKVAGWVMMLLGAFIMLFASALVGTLMVGVGVMMMMVGGVE